MKHLLDGFLDAMEKAAGRPMAPDIDILKQNRVRLTPGEHYQTMAQRAVWHHGWARGKKIATPAVWKSVLPDGKTWYVTGTHRLHSARPTLRAAVAQFHSRIKQTA